MLSNNAKRGRPAFKPTPAQRRKVAIAAGAGMAHEAIALVIGIARNTLTLYFDFELSRGAHTRRMDILEAMFKAARQGNVSAAKAYLALEPRGGGVPNPTPEPDPLPEGKKAQANAAALTASDGTKWDRLLKPKQLQ